jgi:hypothetical protein
MRFLVAAVMLVFGLAACSKSDVSSNSSSAAAPTQLNWDQGNWNQTNWQ